MINYIIRWVGNMQYICLLIPGVFSLVIHKKYYKLNSLLDNFFVYLMYNYIILLIMNIFLNFFSVNKYNIFSIYLFSFNFSMKYMLLSLFISLFLPKLYNIITNNIKISLILERRQK